MAQPPRGPRSSATLPRPPPRACGSSPSGTAPPVTLTPASPVSKPSPLCLQNAAGGAIRSIQWPPEALQRPARPRVTRIPNTPHRAITRRPRHLRWLLAPFLILSILVLHPLFLPEFDYTCRFRAPPFLLHTPLPSFLSPSRSAQTERRLLRKRLFLVPILPDPDQRQLRQQNPGVLAGVVLKNSLIIFKGKHGASLLFWKIRGKNEAIILPFIYKLYLKVTCLLKGLNKVRYRNLPANKYRTDGRIEYITCLQPLDKGRLGCPLGPLMATKTTGK